MPRPRVHDLEHLFDATERLVVESGPAAVTVRVISELTGVSNGAIYHAFGSRSGLVGQTWLRAARRFLALQQRRVDEALASTAGPDGAVEAVVAAADAPAEFALTHPQAGRFLLAVSRDELLGSAGLPDGLAAALEQLDAQLTDLFVELSTNLWDRADGASVAVIRDCVVELPTALLLRGRRRPTKDVRERISASVRAVLHLGPPDPVGPATAHHHHPPDSEGPATGPPPPT
ncbi:MAG TPA: TetR/AcrR family transcriptional regulator [Candidatus Dietzia merdigallinarum]|nr:TetR/AcrR family transcriptional regulator [Candidatus Dietzia merdigallinarum]